MLRIENEIEVKIFEAHIRHHARERKNVALYRPRENHGEPGLLVGKFAHGGHVGTALGQTTQAEFTKRVGSDSGMKCDAIAEQRQVVGEDCGRTAKRESHVRCDVFAVELELRRKAVENKIEIQLADDTEIEFARRGHGIDRAASVENDDSAQIFRLVGIKTFFHASMKTEKLRGNKKRSH